MRRKLFGMISLLMKNITKLIPKKKNRWVFGAWFGKQVSDNPYALYEYISENHPEIEAIWITNASGKKLNCKTAKRNSWKAFFYIVTSEVAVFNQGFCDLCTINILGGVKILQLWHGVPWKKICGDSVPAPRTVIQKIIHWLTKKVSRCDIYIAPSDGYAKIICSAFYAKPEQIIKVGQPRNEKLFDSDFCGKAHDFLLRICNEPCDSKKRIIVYMPTFRDKSQRTESMAEEGFLLDLEELSKEYGFIVIEKSHYVDSMRNGEKKRRNGVVCLQPFLDARILLAGADMLITDYSSCFFDYLIKDKPIIHYLYDYDYYKNKDRGLYYEINDVACGTVAMTREQLLEAIKRNLDNPELEKEKRKKMRERHIPYESCNNSQVIVDEVFRSLKR